MAHRVHETLSPLSAQAEAKVSDFSVLDSLEYSGEQQDDPQAISPSQWGSLSMLRR